MRKVIDSYELVSNFMNILTIGRHFFQDYSITLNGETKECRMLYLKDE